MKASSFFGAVLGAALFSIPAVVGQDFAASHGMYTEPNTGFTFFISTEADGAVSGDGEFSETTLGGYTYGVALPPNAATVDSTEYIGLIVGSTPGGKTGWTGVVHGDNGGAGMPNHLMIIAWPTGVGNTIATSFRYAPSYQAPITYGGSAKLTQIFSSVNSTHWTLVYRCQNCFVFDDPTQTPSNMSTIAAAKQGYYESGWAQAVTPPADLTNPNAAIVQHDNGMGEFNVVVASATQASYSIWASSATATSAPTGTVVPTTVFSSVPVPTATSYDYIVIGGGAGGIPVADKLSESGKSVLLIEKGVASSGRWGGTLRPESHWLDGTNLTWFDVPGECNRIWNGGSDGVACTDTDQMAGCILGGGTAVNAGLWWNPNPEDWDYLFPAGWKSADMAPAAQRVFSRIPGTDHPSADGQLYLQSGFDILRQGLGANGWTSVTANSVPGQKNRTYAHTAYMYSHGERGGPMATYLTTAMARPNFHMWLNTSVERINRSGGHATSLDVIASNDGGYAGTINLTPGTGRVIIAAGTFGTAKLLFRSGIGPTDQLQVVQNSTSDATKMIAQSQWINLPVGYNLDDHLNTDCVISHPNISYYDWVKAWDTPNVTDETNYLTKRIGPLTQAAPDIGPMMWEEITGPDGIVRQFQWTSRVEGSGGVPNGNAMTLSLYLGRGSISRGRTTIQKGLNMLVSTLPWGDVNDLATTAIAIEHMVNSLKTIPNITFNLPPSNMTATQYLASVPLTYANIGARRANHWLGTAKMGTDSGLTGGTSVVDTNTKVYGTDNMFIVDASIFPGMPSTNPSALIVTVGEQAAAKILALAPSSASSSAIKSTSSTKSSSSTSSVKPTTISTSSVKPTTISTSTKPTTTTSASKTSSVPVATQTALPYGQCGGIGWVGTTKCPATYTCHSYSSYYSQCMPS